MLKKIILLILISLNIFSNKIVVLDPAGDSKNNLRTIFDNSEQNLSFNFATELKKDLENSGLNIRILLSRFPGETIEPLQRASYSNALNTDLHINFNFYQEKSKKSKIFIYYLSYDPVIDFWPIKEKLDFMPYDQVYKFNINKSLEYANFFYKLLKKDPKIQLFSPLGIPFKPLIGLSIPSISVEIGISDEKDFNLLIDLFKAALVNLLTNI